MKSRVNFHKYWISLILLINISACMTPHQFNMTDRPLNWATKLKNDSLNNCFQIDEKLIRCGQLTPQGFDTLEQMGVKTIINLREYHSDKDLIVNTQLKLIEVPLTTFNVSDDDVNNLLKHIQDTSGPVVVHCWHGADRTGTISAAYRIKQQNWSNDEALNEMRHGGFGYHSLFSNLETLIKNFKPLDN